MTRIRDAHRDLCDHLKKQRMSEFMDGFTTIGASLKEMYQMITLGGDASLDLVDSLDPFSEGVSFGYEISSSLRAAMRIVSLQLFAFSVRPPKKSWKQITNLSGGEKTLASLALVFGLHHYRPTPLYVMDEIDAALDFRNVSIISNYVKVSHSTRVHKLLHSLTTLSNPIDNCLRPCLFARSFEDLSTPIHTLFPSRLSLALLPSLTCSSVSSNHNL